MKLDHNIMKILVPNSSHFTDLLFTRRQKVVCLLEEGSFKILVIVEKVW